MISTIESHLEEYGSHIAGGLITSAGIISLVSSGFHLAKEPFDVTELTFGAGIPALLALVLIAAGTRVYRAEYEDHHAFRLTLWWLAGLTTAAVMAVVLILYERSHDTAIVDATHVIINNVTAGSLGGLFVGFYDIRSRQKSERLEAQAAELEAERSHADKQREQLEVLNRILRHDIRNDLTVIDGMSELAMDRVDDEGREYLERVNRSVTDAINLTETAREYVNALESGGSRKQKPVEVTHVLGSQIERAAQAYPEAEIEATVPDTEVYASADDMLASVIRNLLVNAIQHNDSEHPQVEVAVKQRDESVIITTADNGPGIPDAQKDEVFGRGEKGLESGGSGIGLYLVDAIVTEYGGQVWIEDAEPRGAKFVVCLKSAQPPTSDAPNW